MKITEHSSDFFYRADYCPYPIDRFPIGVVGDQVPPEITHPGDREVYAGVQFSIRWNGVEDYPDYYYVYVDGSLYRSGSWESNSLSINFRFEELGNYTITVQLVDWFMNSVNDTVIVHVIEAPDPTTTTTTSTTTTTNETTTGEQPLVGMLSIGFAGVIVVVFIATIVQKKSS
ncbi:MAG: hypothetical protein ACTSR9_12120 [Candidatus Thorarchaeota archaeon]